MIQTVLKVGQVSGDGVLFQVRLGIGQSAEGPDALLGEVGNLIGDNGWHKPNRCTGRTGLNQTSFCSQQLPTAKPATHFWVKPYAVKAKAGTHPVGLL